MKRSRTKLALLAFLGMMSVVNAWAQDVAKIGDTYYTSLEAAFAAAEDGQTITLLADCAGNGIFVGPGKYATGVTVDFGGFTYTVDGSTVGSTGTETQAFHLEKDNKFTFKNGTIYSQVAKMLVQNYSNLTLKGMTLTLNNSSYTSAYTLSNNNGNVVIDGTTINANPAGGFAFDVCRYASYPSVNVEVKGESVINGDIEISASGNDAKDGFVLTLTAGTLDGNIVLDASAAAAMEATPGKVSITKGEDFVVAAPEGYKWVSNGDGTYSLQELPDVAKIGETGYKTLEAAFAAAQDGETITLLADCAGNGIIAPQGKFNTTGLTVDFGGFTYSVTGNLVGSSGTETQAFQLLKDNKITFQDGTITSEKAKILVQNYSDLTLEGMTLTLNNANYAYGYTLSNNNGNVVIDGTTINANQAGGFAFDVCRYSSYPSVSVEVKGDSEINGNIEISASGSDAKDGFVLTLTAGTLNGEIVLDPSAATAMEATPDKVSITKGEDFVVAAPEGYKWNCENGTCTLVKCEYVAQIGQNKYETFEAAFAAAQDGETITLLADCAGNGIKAPEGKFTTGLTVDFDGHTYTMDGAMVGSTGTQTQAFQLLKDNIITFKNGTIYSEKAKILVQNYSDLTLEGMTLTLNNSSYTSAYTLSNNNGNVVIDGTTINANPAGGFAFDVCRYASYPSVNVEVKGESVINGNIEIFASGSDAKDGFGLTLTAGTLNGEIVLDASAAAAMEATPEKAVITKADTFEADAPADYKWVSNGDGTSSLAPNDAVAMIGNTYYSTFTAAVEAANVDDVITLLANIEDAYTLSVDETLKVALNDFTLTVNAPEGFKVKISEADGVTTYTLVEIPMSEKDFVINDDEHPAYTFTTDTEVNSITYIRTFVPSIYQAWFVPFEYTITSDDLEKFVFYKINMIANSPNNDVSEESDEIWIFINKMTAGQKLKANYPYIIKPLTADVEGTFVVTENATLYAKTDNALAKTETMENIYTFYGTNNYVTLTPQDTELGYYLGIEGTLSHPENKSISIKPYRWILRVTSKNGSNARPVNFSIADDSEATGLRNIVVEEEGDTYYTLDGLKVQTPSKGVYIKKSANGETKKVTFK